MTESCSSQTKIYGMDIVANWKNTKLKSLFTLISADRTSYTYIAEIHWKLWIYFQEEKMIGSKTLKIRADHISEESPIYHCYKHKDTKSKGSTFEQSFSKKLFWRRIYQY